MALATPTASPQTEPPPIWLSALVWSIPAFFYLTAFYLRSSPAVTTLVSRGSVLPVWAASTP